MKMLPAPKRYRALQCTPYINSYDELVVPISCDSRFHYWRHKRMTLLEVLEYANASEDVIKKYYTPPVNTKHFEMEEE